MNYVAIADNRVGYDLGFRRDGEAYELVADFWGTKINQTEFVNAISQKYAHKTLMQSVADQGFNIEAEETLEVSGTLSLGVVLCKSLYFFMNFLLVLRSHLD